MEIQTLKAFLMGCTIINGCLLIFWSLMCMLAPELVYRTQSKFFPISRETYHIVIYSFLGLFKIVFTVFNLVPWLVLNIIA